MTVIQLMSPEALLKKGFAIVYYKGKITGNPDALSPGDEITVRLSDTELHTIITTKNKSNGTTANL
jgi:exodeoxyribonuclease VII large subunit